MLSAPAKKIQCTRRCVQNPRRLGCGWTIRYVRCTSCKSCAIVGSLAINLDAEAALFAKSAVDSLIRPRGPKFFYPSGLILSKGLPGERVRNGFCLCLGLAALHQMESLLAARSIPWCIRQHHEFPANAGAIARGASRMQTSRPCNAVN